MLTYRPTLIIPYVILITGKQIIYFGWYKHVASRI